MNYREFLKEALEKRRQKNSVYSLRAFSRQLEMSPAALSQVLSGKRPLTPKAAFRIAAKLCLSPLETSALVESTIHVTKVEAAPGPTEIREDEFQLIADWYHLAILSLSDLRHHKADPRWISGQLGITVAEAATALNRLKKLRIIEIKNGKMTQIMKPIRTTSDVPSTAIQRYHQQILDIARDVIERVAVADREYSTITMAVSKKNLAKAKKLITEFKRRLSDVLEVGEKEAVYTLAIQLFPVSGKERK